LTCFDTFLKLLDTWPDVVVNDFIERQTSSFMEGRKRRCNGLRNVGRLFQRLTWDLEGYRRFSPWSAAAH
jgi:hypothetical protein